MTFKIAVVWLLGALFLVILASFLPKVAVWITALILLGVILSNTKQYTAFIEAITLITGG